MKAQKRDLTIDTFRGISIILVILGHCVQKTELPLNQVILSFHMPLFFFCSGMLANKVRDGEYFKFLIKKTKNFVWPQLFVACTDILYVILFDVFILKNTLMKNVSLIDYMTSWFLIVLLYVTLIFPLILKMDILKNKRGIFAFLIIEIILLIVSASLNISTRSSLEKIPVALFFYTVGYFFKIYEMKKYLIKVMEKIWILVIPMIVLIADKNEPVRMYQNDYGNVILFLTTSFLGIAFIYYVAEYIHTNKILLIFGEKSIIVFCTHFIVIKMFRLLINFFLRDSFTTMDYPWYFFLFICTIVTEQLILYIWEHLKGYRINKRKVVEI